MREQAAVAHQRHEMRRDRLAGERFARGEVVDAAARGVEANRVAGADANPYLVAATVLAGMAKGLDGYIDPGPETTGNGYEAAASARAGMPADWRSAIEAARASDFLKSALGADMHRTFTAIKEAEYLRVARTVADLDYHLYLHEV